MHDLSLYLLDILENSVRAGATVIATTIVADRVRGRAQHPASRTTGRACR